MTVTFSPAGAEPVAQGEALVLADGHLRDVPESAFWLELAVAGDCHNVDDHGGAEFLRPGVRIEQAGAIGSRMAAAAGNEGAVDDNGLALDVATNEIGFGADANPYHFGRDTLRTGGLGAGNWEGGDKFGLATV